MGYSHHMHTIIETPIFTRRADALLSQADRDALIAMIAADPRAGALVPGWGGIRKLRFGPAGRGKSGGFRVIYWLGADNVPVLVLLLYGKNEQVNPSQDQVTAMLRAVKSLMEHANQRRK